MSAVPSRAAAASRRAACFSLITAHDPGMLPRVLASFAKRGWVPDHIYSRVVRDPPEPHLCIDVQMTGLDSDTARQLADGFRAIPGVASVLLSV